MRFACITDLHIGKSAYHNGIRRKLSEHCEQLINTLCHTVNNDGDYDFVIQLGDLIEDESHAADSTNYQTGVNLLNQAQPPVYHVTGNHDAVFLDQADRLRISGTQSAYYSFDSADCHCIVLHSLVPNGKLRPIHICDQQIEWLKADLAATTKPTVVFVHHALSDQDLNGNPWHEGIPEQCLVQNRVEVRGILAASNTVVAVFCGHLHWNRIDMHDGIPYCTLQSATENFKNIDTPAASWGEVQIANSKVQVTVHGNDQLAFTLPFPVRVKDHLATVAVLNDNQHNLTQTQIPDYEMAES